jgi:hypothetical protein
LMEQSVDFDFHHSFRIIATIFCASLLAISSSLASALGFGWWTESALPFTAVRCANGGGARRNGE